MAPLYQSDWELHEQIVKNVPHALIDGPSIQTMAAIEGIPGIRLKSTKKLNKPFQNTQMVEFWLNRRINAYLTQHFRSPRYHHFSFKAVDFGIWTLEKSIKIDTEVFPSGRIAVYLTEHSDLYFSGERTRAQKEAFLGLLKKAIHNGILGVNLNIHIDQSKKFVRMLDHKGLPYFEKLLLEEQFQKINLSSSNLENIDPKGYDTLHPHLPAKAGRINLMYFPLISQLSRMEGIEWEDYPNRDFRFDDAQSAIYFRDPLRPKLVIRKMSSLYYTGVWFSNVSQKICILPMIHGSGGSPSLSIYKDLISNNFAQNHLVEWLPVLRLDLDRQITDQIFKYIRENNLRTSTINYTLLAYEKMIPGHIYSEIKECLRVVHCIDANTRENFEISNACFSHLVRAGAVVPHVKSDAQVKDQYYMGIDLGHNAKEKISTLSVSLIDENFQWMASAAMVQPRHDEQIDQNTLMCLFEKMKQHLLDLKKPITSLVIHRDGRFLKADMDVLLTALACVFELSEDRINILEVTKSGAPYMFGYRNSKYHNAAKGWYLLLEEEQTGYLMSTDQTVQEDQLIQPIKIKNKIGSQPLDISVRQVYGMCCSYKDNLYFNSRMPATTYYADRLVDKHRIFRNGKLDQKLQNGRIYFLSNRNYSSVKDWILIW